MVDFFRAQFAALPVAMELVPALGAENAVALAQQAMQLGGCDAVLVHPEFCRDRSPQVRCVCFEAPEGVCFAPPPALLLRMWSSGSQGLHLSGMHTSRKVRFLCACPDLRACTNLLPPVPTAGPGHAAAPAGPARAGVRLRARRPHEGAD